MKVTLLIISLLWVFVSFQSKAFNIYESEAFYQKVCLHTKQNDMQALKQLFNSHRLQIRLVFGAVTCDGSNLVQYAAEHDAQKTGAFIIRRLPKVLLIDELEQLPEDDPLREVVAKRIMVRW